MKKLLCIIVVGLLLLAGVVNQSKFGFQGDYQDKVFLKTDPEKVVKAIQEKKAGLYYFGFPACPWCQELVPVLEDVLASHKGEVHMVNTKAKLFSKSNHEQMTAFYKEHLGGDRLYVPLLVAINSKGEIKAHSGTIDGHDASQEALSEKQIIALKMILEDLLNHSKS